MTKHAQSSHVFTEKDLWGADGRPGGNDIQQKSLGDCFLVAAAGSVAQQTPDVIRSGIRYDAQSGSFSVRLFKDGQWTSVSVTQAELHQNLEARGGSTFRIGEAETSGAIWPAIYEVGYAKQLAGSWEAGKTMLDKGGDPADALHAITGEDPITVRASELDGLPPQQIVDRIHAELADGRRIVMTTKPDPGQGQDDPSALDTARFLVDLAQRPGTVDDGVVGRHAYMVFGARLDPDTGEVMLRVRNPHGNNNNVDPIQKKPNPEAENEISLQRLMRLHTRSFGKFDIADLSQTQRELFQAIRSRVGTVVGDDAVAAATVLAGRNGLHRADDVAAATVTADGRLLVAGHTPGFRIMLDTHALLPTLQESMASLSMEAARTCAAPEQRASGHAPERA
ncbi:MAG: hypothetical protein DI635_07420 [Pseudoxanthomonas suwonensis]|nr:MAG: hypothetical protein DI635_07420 [Pseudoxanthomonas suwonensis]